MFHCTIDGDYIVLLDEIARSLLFEATGDAGRSLTYNMEDLNGKSKTANTNCNVIIRFLQSLKNKDPEAFRKRFIFHSCWGRDGAITFLTLADGHRRLFSYMDSTEIDDLDRASSDPVLWADYRAPASISIQLLSKTGFFGKKRITIADIIVHSCDVDHVFGTTREFVMMTKMNKFKFTPEGLLVEPRIIDVPQTGDA